MPAARYSLDGVPGGVQAWVGFSHQSFKTNFVARFLAADDTQRLETYPLTRDGLARFARQLTHQPHEVFYPRSTTSSGLPQSSCASFVFFLRPNLSR